MTTPEEWFNSIPYITKLMWITSMVLTLLTTTSLLQPHYFALLYDEAVLGFQFWRFITCALYFGPISIQWLTTISFFLQYLRNYESMEYATPRKKMDFILVLSIGIGIFSALSFFWRPTYFIAYQLTAYVAYLWSRKEPMRPINFYGFTLKAWNTPLLLVFMDILFGRSVADTVVACLVGHLVHVIRNMVPHRYGFAPLKCPDVVEDWSEKAFSPTNHFGVTTTRQPQQPPRPAWAQGAGHRID